MYDIYFVINEMRKERVMNEGNNRNNFASDIKNFMTRVNECFISIQTLHVSNYGFIKMYEI